MSNQEGTQRRGLNEEFVRQQGQRFDTTDFLTALLRVAPEPLSSSEIAEGVGCSDKTAKRRLRSLGDSGLVHTKLIGSGRAWWIDPADQPFKLEDVEGVSDLSKEEVRFLNELDSAEAESGMSQ